MQQSPTEPKTHGLRCCQNQAVEWQTQRSIRYPLSSFSLAVQANRLGCPWVVQWASGEARLFNLKACTGLPYDNYCRLSEHRCCLYVAQHFYVWALCRHSLRAAPRSAVRTKPPDATAANLAEACGQVGNPFVAVQRGFSIADAHSLPNRQNPIRSFAAPWADVSHADITAIAKTFFGVRFPSIAMREQYFLKDIDLNCCCAWFIQEKSSWPIKVARLIRSKCSSLTHANRVEPSLRSASQSELR